MAIGFQISLMKRSLKKLKKRVRVQKIKSNSRFRRAALIFNKTLSLIHNSLTRSIQSTKVCCQMAFPFVMKNYKTLMCFLSRILISILTGTSSCSDKRKKRKKILCTTMYFRIKIHSRSLRISRTTHSRGQPRTLRSP